MTSIEEKLNRIRDRAAALNEKTDRLNCLYANIQRRLDEAFDGGGIEFWLDQEFAHDGVHGVSWQLGYARPGTVWQLCVRPISSASMPDAAPLTMAPRRVRIAAAAMLAPFWSGLLDHLTVTESKLDAAIQAVNTAWTQIP